MCRTTQGSRGGERNSETEIGGGGSDPPIISIIDGLNLLVLLFPYVYTVIWKPKDIFGCQGDLIGKV